MKTGRHGRQPQRAGARLKAAAPWLAIAVGLVVLAWPIATSWIEAYRASQNIQEVTDTYSYMDDPERTALFDEAVHYNEVLAAGGDLSQAEPYEKQLSFHGSEMIAYVSIPKCSIRLPIFHGTEDKVLAAGVGHLEGTSLPAGGPTSHCVLTAHTGLPGRLMFDDIGLLEPGDEFVVWVLGRPLAFEVTGSEVVLPDETSSLAIVEGQELMTLVTCTPYGINSHRLLVHAQRCEYVEGDEAIPDVAVYVNNRTAPFIASVVILLLLAVSLGILRYRRQHRR